MILAFPVYLTQNIFFFSKVVYFSMHKSGCIIFILEFKFYACNQKES